MDKTTRNTIERATQHGRKLLDEDFSSQLEGTFDVLRSGVIASKGGAHLSELQRSQRDKIMAAIEHKRSAGMAGAEAVRDYVRDSAFTTLNRFVALKMLEARELAQECITRGELSAGYHEFCGMAPGVALLPDSAGYRLYIESLFDEFSTEIKVLFDRRDAASVLWPKRATFEALLELLNAPDLATVWGEDETIGWVYQFFNGGDERRAMREASQAPRNSRELAVRNQFFTPRYVVQFLADNTLGRMWAEMYRGDTRLVGLCEYLVRGSDGTYVPREKKDPRDIRVLDPACGSGHFLLYAFDLFLPIYEEAWEDVAAPKSEPTGRSLREDYPDFAALKAAIPALILRYNLHGLDLDTRCAQIAQLALWMRAQRAYTALGISRSERAVITRLNIVVPEPMPGEIELKKEFFSSINGELKKLVEAVFQKMELAGDLGSLLRIEHEIKSLISEFFPSTGELFRPNDEERWRELEDELLAALRRYSDSTHDAHAIGRQLFAENAARGFAFIDLCRIRYDVVLMNPPFGLPIEGHQYWLKEQYPTAYVDLYPAMVSRGAELAPGGLVGAITSRSFLLAKTLTDWRMDFAVPRVILLLDLGSPVMDGAMVESCASIFGQSRQNDYFAVYDCRKSLEKGRCALEVLKANSPTSVLRRDEVLSLFRGKVIYAASSIARRLLSADQDCLGKGMLHAKQGLKSFDDFRFFRLRWEVPFQDIGRDKKWEPITRGGGNDLFFTEITSVVRWENDGMQLAEENRKANGQTAQSRQALRWYWRTGCTYTWRAESFRVALLPAGVIIGGKGPAILPDGDTDPLFLLGLLNSTPYRALVELQANANQYETGIVEKLPKPILDPTVTARVTDLARKAVLEYQEFAARSETSSFFRGLDLGTSLGEIRSSVDKSRKEVEQNLKSILADLDRIVGDALSLTKDDVAALIDASGVDSELRVGVLVGNQSSDVLSFCVGTALGRWTKPRATPVLSEDLVTALLPVHPPAMAVGESLRGGVVVDDQGNIDDIGALILRTLSEVLPATSEEELLRDLAAASSGKPHRTIRGWIASEFFDDHLKTYSSSRRRAPIYWQLATPSLSYSVWLYIHAFTKDTLFRVQNDYVAPKLVHEERKLESLRRELGDNPKASDLKDLARQEVFVEELRAFVDEVKRLAPLWNPNLDDGVIINFAPLWRLVQHHKPWQKELKATWDEVCAGEHDWTHLAMHLWPERVVPKCATDRSLAIAHGLDGVFWVKADDGKWKPRPTPTSRIDELLRERTSVAVKAALKSLLEAPVANANGGRRRRAANAAAEMGAR